MTEISKCSECGVEFDPSQMVAFENEMICGGCKHVYVQRLREGVKKTSVLGGVFGEWLGLGRTLSLSFEHYQKNFGTIFGLVCIAQVPSILISSVLVALVANGAIPMPAFSGLNTLTAIAVALISLVCSVGMIYSIDQSVNDNPISFGEAWSQGVSLFRGIFGTLFLAGLIILGMTLLLIIPGIIWSVFYCFVMPVAVLTGMRGKEALDYSKSLVTGRWWTVVGFFFVANILVSVAGGIFQVAGALVTSVPGVGPYISLAVGLPVGIIQAFITVFTTIFFLNLHTLRQAETQRT